ncbi:MAG: diaminopimelate epimerase [Raineya sp.]|nr:diaminopimelate epimerase [Raineya sp.]MDW8296194.1 diaminopimelate epimerase [Raineya sp.]
MKILFEKYQGTGNDFIMIDNRGLYFPKETALIARLCHRRFGIGADGLILLESTPEADFRMIYYNADGKEGSMCGNGGRCVVSFAKSLGLFEKETRFLAVDGLHEAFFKEGLVHLKMKEVSKIEKNTEGYYFLDTGSPHYVEFVQDVEQMNVFEKGRAIRYNQRFGEKGTNVNFVEILGENLLRVRTYERGVEAETYSCGTGVTASAIVYALQKPTQTVQIKTLGGDLWVNFKEKNGNFYDIFLAGKAEKVFEGQIET